MVPTRMIPPPPPPPAPLLFCHPVLLSSAMDLSTRAALVDRGFFPSWAVRDRRWLVDLAGCSRKATEVGCNGLGLGARECMPHAADSLLRSAGIATYGVWRLVVIFVFAAVSVSPCHSDVLTSGCPCRHFLRCLGGNQSGVAPRHKDLRTSWVSDDINTRNNPDRAHWPQRHPTIEFDRLVFL